MLRALRYWVLGFLGRSRWPAIVLVVWGVMATGANAAHVLATVNGQIITRKDVINIVPQAAQNANVLHLSLQRYINTLLILDDARRLHLELAARRAHVPADSMQEWLVHAAEQRWLVEHPITMHDIRLRYRQYLASLPPQQWRLRVIQVEHRQSALEVIAALRRGENFSRLAAQHPETPHAAFGGELGWVDPGKLEAAVRQAVSPLQMLQIVGPVSVPQGLVIVQLLGRRKTPRPSLDAVRPDLIKVLRTQRLEKYAARLRKRADIVFNR